MGKRTNEWMDGWKLEENSRKAEYDDDDNENDDAF